MRVFCNLEHARLALIVASRVEVFPPSRHDPTADSEVLIA